MPAKKQTNARKRATKTLQQLADEQGRTRQAIHSQEKAGRDPALAVKIQQAQLRKTRLEGDKLERLMKVLDSEFYPKTEVDQGFQHMGAVIGLLFQAMSTEFPSLLAGMEPAAIEKVCRKFADEWTDKLKDIESETHQAARERIASDARGDLRKVAKSMKGDGKRGKPEGE